MDLAISPLLRDLYSDVQSEEAFADNLPAKPLKVGTFSKEMG